MAAPLSREEFLTYMGMLKESVDDGFDGVHRRQDITNGRVAKAEDRLLRLERRSPPAGAPWGTIKAKLAAAATAGAFLLGTLIKVLESLGYLK